jgi:hypothetical protein
MRFVSALSFSYFVVSSFQGVEIKNYFRREIFVRK